MFSKLVLNKDNIFDVVKSIVISLVFSLLFILIFAVFVKYLSLGEEVIVPINYVIKILSILLGSIVGFKKAEKGAVKGIVVGTLYYLLSLLLFSILSGSFEIVKFSAIDLICLSLVGVISGIITVNVKK